MKCPACNDDVESGERFCGSCAYDLRTLPANTAAKPELVQTTCTHCGTTLKRGKQFCGSCGEPLAPAPALEAQACPSCGELAEPSERFCSSCGCMLGGTGESQGASSPQTAKTAGGLSLGALAGAASRVQFGVLLAASGFVLALLSTIFPWRIGRTSEWSTSYTAWQGYVPEAVFILVIVGVGLLTLIAPLPYAQTRWRWWSQCASAISAIIIITFGVLFYLAVEPGTFETSVGTYQRIRGSGPYVLISGGIVAMIGTFLYYMGGVLVKAAASAGLQ